MNNFELTERGKIVIAVVIVVILLVIPLVIILGISSCSGTPVVSPPDSGPSSSLPSQSPKLEETPGISETPLPAEDNGAGSSDDSTPEPAETPEPAASPDPTATPDPVPEGDSNDDGGEANGSDEYIEYGPVGLNITAGTMQFMFSTAEQKTLDDETVEMLKDFLSSPKNTGNSLIKIEIPNLSDNDEAVLTSAVAEAFSKYNVPESRLLYVSGVAGAYEQNFEVALSFTPISNQK